MYAMGFMIAYIIAYFAALMFAHFAAFKVEINIQKTAFKRLMNMPLGYFDVHETGAIRKTINDGNLSCLTSMPRHCGSGLHEGVV